MDFLLDALTKWLKEMLVGGIMSNLSGLFDSVNQQVADISVQVGQTPQGWNSSIFSMIENLSNSIMVPIAGVILAIVMTVDLIQMIADKNNLHDVDTWMIFKWVFKSAAAILLVTNTWNIVMGVFDMAQSVVAQAAGIIGSDASIDISSVLADMEPRLMEMDLGPLFGLWFQSLFIGITMWALYICIFIVIYGRMIEIYLVTSVAPLPMAAMMGKEWGGMGQNYLRSLLALGFQAFLIIVCVAIYASEIEVRLGATWIDKEYIQQFMYETFNTPFYLQRSIEVNYSSFTAEWQIKGKSSVSYNDVAAYTTYGTSRANAYKILEDSLNLRDVRIYDTIEDADGKERRVLNAKETTLAAQKQQAIREAFRDWIWRDPERRQTLVRQYNEEMNSTRPREYDGSHITFGGMNPAITLREHQKSAIAHVLYGGNTLLAHEVGAGKTFEMVAAAMEAKRLGLCQKSLFVVPNHLTEQWASEFLRLYPSANILVTTKKDFETHNRKKFCARIATGDYDAIIMGHSQFERIPISRERQERLLYEQIDEITEGIAEVQASGGERFTVKQLERTRKSLEARLEKLQAEGRKDDVVTFEQLGVREQSRNGAIIGMKMEKE